MSNILIDKKKDLFNYNKKTLIQSFIYINNNNAKFAICKLFYNTNDETISNIYSYYQSFLMYLTFCFIDGQIKVNLLFNGAHWNKLYYHHKINIYNFVFNLINYLQSNLVISFKINTFGYLFQPIICKKIDKKKNKFTKYNYFINVTKDKHLLDSMKMFIMNNKLDLGIYLYENVISKDLEQEIQLKLEPDLQNNNYIQDKTTTRIKLTYGYNYVFFNKYFKNNPIQWKIEEKIANGIRFDPKNSNIPLYFLRIIKWLKKNSIINKQQEINQISVVHYFNKTKKSEIFESIGPHNERLKFDYLCALYIGISSELSINLKWNTVHGEYCIHLPSNCCIVFDSMSFFLFFFSFFVCFL